MLLLSWNVSTKENESGREVNRRKVIVTKYKYIDIMYMMGSNILFLKKKVKIIELGKQNSDLSNHLNTQLDCQRLQTNTR